MFGQKKHDRGNSFLGGWKHIFGMVWEKGVGLYSFTIWIYGEVVKAIITNEFPNKKSENKRMKLWRIQVRREMRGTQRGQKLYLRNQWKTTLLVDTYQYFKIHRGFKITKTSKRKRWCQSQEIIAKIKIMKLSPCFLLEVSQVHMICLSLKAIVSWLLRIV